MTATKQTLVNLEKSVNGDTCSSKNFKKEILQVLKDITDELIYLQDSGAIPTSYSTLARNNNQSLEDCLKSNKK